MAHINYCSHIWGNTFDFNKKYIILLQNRAIKYISYKNDTQSSSEFMFKKRIWSFDTLVKFNSLQFIYRGYNNLLPLNIQYRLKKNTYNPDNCIRGSSRTSRNLFE